MSNPNDKNYRVVDGLLTYQYRKLIFAVNRVKSPRKLAIDVGGHVGLWSMWLVSYFERVIAFEPQSSIRNLFHRNLATRKATNYSLLPFGLSNQSRVSSLIDPFNGVSTGSLFLDPHPKEGSASIMFEPLDSLDFRDVSFIKIDVEGHELAVLEGAIDTITRDGPIVVIEQKGLDVRNYGRPKDEACNFLLDHGYQVIKVISGDYIMGPKNV